MADQPEEKPMPKPEQRPARSPRAPENDPYEEGPIPDMPLSRDPLGNPGPTPPEAGKEPD